MFADPAIRQTPAFAPPQGVAGGIAAPLAWKIRVSSLTAGIFASLGLQQLLLWRFLDFAPIWLYLLGGALVVGTSGSAFRASAGAGAATVSLGRLGFCLIIALSLFLLGGEGRLLYANLDWQVRDAVLRDLALHPWPFAYELSGVEMVLRAPLGMYMLPALAGKLLGMRGAGIALLLQNSLFLAAILGAMSTLFETAGRRLIALLVFLTFSGMNLIGCALVYFTGGLAKFPDHLDPWGPLEYSSHVTQAFWVPQHALAGWLCAALFLLWKDGRIRVGWFLAAIPVLALWSPLAIMGAVPFALYAAAATLGRRLLCLGDILLPAATLALALPALVYLKADAGSVGGRFYPIAPAAYVVFMLLEVAPYLAGGFIVGRNARFGGVTLLIVAASLLSIPLYQIGETGDFAMRASIPALAILSVIAADALTRAFATGRPIDASCGRLLVFALAVGAATGAMEVRRAFIYRPSPLTHCTLIGSWDQQVGLLRVAKSTYLAPAASLPGSMQAGNSSLVDRRHEPQPCWNRPWQVAR